MSDINPFLEYKPYREKKSYLGIVNVYLRICPFKSIHHSPFWDEDKFQLVSHCLQSFREAFDRQHYRLIFISDCAEKWRKDLQKPHDKWIECPGAGNFGTFKEQLNRARWDARCLLLEDDYLWKPSVSRVFMEALSKYSLVFPYDHPKHYTEPEFAPVEMIKDGHRQYRTCKSNTLTFATTGDFIRRHYNTFTTHGVQDHALFSELSQEAKLVCPIPSLATHLVADCMAPGVDWHSVAKMYDPSLE